MDLYNEKQALITHKKAILEAMTLVKITRIDSCLDLSLMFLTTTLALCSVEVYMIILRRLA